MARDQKTDDTSQLTSILPPSSPPALLLPQKCFKSIFQNKTCNCEMGLIDNMLLRSCDDDHLHEIVGHSCCSFGLNKGEYYLRANPCF